jgi:hypothetical protein
LEFVSRKRLNSLGWEWEWEREGQGNGKGDLGGEV